jgi:hypothetical protein
VTWDQKRIADWGRATFGVPENALGIIVKAREEFDELEAECLGEGHVEVDKILEEAADVVLCLYQLVDNLAGNMQDELDKKMEINSNRTWVKTGDGVGRHV